MSLEKDDLIKWLRDNPDLAKKNPGLGISVPVDGATPPKEHKYHVAPKADRTYNGKVYHSKKEATRAQENDLRIRAGELSFHLTQVPFRLPGGITYRADFAEFLEINKRNLYEVHFIDTKGYDTPVSDLKRKQVLALFGIEIEVV